MASKNPICTVCENLVQNRNNAILCTYCNLQFHMRCIKFYDTKDINMAQKNTNGWMCKDCRDEVFPFRDIEDITALMKSSLADPVLMPEDMLNQNFFIDQDSETMDENNILDSINPDLNFYADCESIVKDSKYFSIDTFNEAIIPNMSKKQHFSLLHTNIRSMSKNLDNFVHQLHFIKHKFSCIGISETWLNEFNNDLFAMDGYTHTKNYRKNKTGGGVSIFIDDKLNFKIRNDLTESTDQ